jgi:ribosome-binding protein aMBF1 (putative translation factor)
MPDETLLVDDFGKIISQQRQKLEMTQKEFGVFLGVKLSELKMIENGKLRPDDATAKKMGNKLGLSLFE